MTAVTKPGVYEDMPAEVYHADPTPNGSLSASWARRLMEPAGPAKFIHERHNPQPPKKIFEYGHAAHALVLGVGAPIARIPAKLLSKNGAAGTNEARAFIAEAREAGAIPLKDAEADEVEAMADALRSHPEAAKLLTARESRAELSAFHTDPHTGMWLRCRFDSISPSGIVDYKTIVDADPSRFARRTAHELGYHQQAAWYLDAAKALNLTDGPFRFILQEKKAPYLVSVVELHPDYLAIGYDRNRAAIDLYARCLASDEWPGYTGVTTAEPPAWLVDSEPSVIPDEMAAQLAAYADELAAETAAHTKENAT